MKVSTKKLQSMESHSAGDISVKKQDSVIFSKVSPKQKYYKENVDYSFISEMTIYDEELDSDYVIHISLPPGYNKESLSHDKSYSLLMLTDGIWHLESHVMIRTMMQKGEIEDIIVVSVGLGYERKADRTPIRAIEFVRKNNLFLDFITTNLIPCLEKLYRIDYSHSTLLGHSLGGLFTYYAVFCHDRYENQPFSYYIVASPSLWVTKIGWFGWHYGQQSKIIKDYFKRNQSFPKVLYLAAGNREKHVRRVIGRVIRDMQQYGVKTVGYEIFAGNHVSYQKDMLARVLLKFYGM